MTGPPDPAPEPANGPAPELPNGPAPDPASEPASYRVEHSHAFDGGVAEVRRYFWARPIDQQIVGLAGAVGVNLALTSRPSRTRVDRMSAAADPLAVDAGRLVIVIPGVPYWLAAPSGSVRSLQCTIGCERFERIAGEPIDWSKLGPFAGEMRAGLAIEGNLAAIYDELVRNRLGRDAAIEAHIDLICVELVRQFRQGRPARPDVMRGGLAAWRIRTITSRVHGDGPPPRVVELADLCGLTERQLSRAFKAETGQNIGRYIDQVTIERAHRLLTTTSHPLPEVARLLGYASVDSFAQAYRRATGMRPAQVRRQ